jgi:hypothetical protein
MTTDATSAWRKKVDLCTESGCRNVTAHESGCCSRCPAKLAPRPPAALKEPARA